MDLDVITELARNPEYSSLETFVEFCLDDDRDTFTHVELRALALNLQQSGNKLRKELESFGLTLAPRGPVKASRGFTANSHDRWHGPGACQSHGGSGWEQIQGFAGRRG